MRLSKIAEKCKKCKYVDTCEHKEMEVVESMILPFKNGINNEAGLKILESTTSPSPIVGVIGHGNIQSTLIEAIVNQVITTGLKKEDQNNAKK